jgi:hypothetical protein
MEELFACVQSSQYATIVHLRRIAKYLLTSFASAFKMVSEYSIVRSWITKILVIAGGTSQTAGHSSTGSSTNDTQQDADCSGRRRLWDWSEHGCPHKWMTSIVYSVFICLFIYSFLELHLNALLFGSAHSQIYPTFIDTARIGEKDLEIVFTRL